MQHISSSEGRAKPFLIQPFFNYNTQKGRYVNASSEINLDFEGPPPRRWTIG